MTKVVRYYLYLLPFYSLIGIYLATIRIINAENFAQLFLLVGFILDIIVITSSLRSIFKQVTLIVLILLFFSFLTGFFNGYELSRRYITDFTNPFFFFAKILVFAKYWRRADFKKYTDYYKKITLWGSLIFLPITYFLFLSSGSTRLSIFPPLELTLPTYLVGNNIIFILVTFLAILLYGKRAQLIGALLVILSYFFLFQRKNFIKVLVSLFLLSITMYLFVQYNSENLAIQRVLLTLEMIDESKGSSNQIETVTGSRYYEITSILKEMNSWYDYFLGKGLGFEYILDGETISVSKIHSNAHFTPIALLSKYGLLFTVFFYVYVIRLFFNSTKSSKNYQIALLTALFVLVESFFAYAIFVLPIFPIALGYLKRIKDNEKVIYRL